MRDEREGTHRLVGHRRGAGGLRRAVGVLLLQPLADAQALHEALPPPDDLLLLLRAALLLLLLLLL